MKMQQLMAGIVASCVAVGTAQAGLVIRPADDERAIVTSDGDDEVIIVKTNTTLTVSGSGTIDLLVVGGGGGGGARYGGGDGTLVVKGPKGSFTVKAELSPRERRLILCGGLLASLRG